jgi:hypothetical protein
MKCYSFVHSVSAWDLCLQEIEGPQARGNIIVRHDARFPFALAAMDELVSN